MNAERQAALRAAARANPACAAPLAARDCATLADLLSVDRTKANALEIGYGTILEVLGIGEGNRLIDYIKSNDDLRYVVPLLDQGRLRIGSGVVQAALQSFVGAGAITQVNADRMCAIGLEPDPPTPQEIAEALFNPDGSEKQ